MSDYQRDELIERVAAALAKTHAAGQTTFSALAEAAFTEMIASKETRRYGPKADDTWESRYVTRWRPRQ